MHAQSLSTPQPLAQDLAQDADLVASVRAGDRRAMEVLIRRHNRAMYRTARAILRDDAEAEDVVQDAYLRAFAALDAFRGDSSLSTWLVRIAANEALMRRRRDARRAVVIPLVDADLATVENVRDETPDAEQGASNAQLRRILEQRIDALPDLYRAVFVMRAVEEMS